MLNRCSSYAMDKYSHSNFFVDAIVLFTNPTMHLFHIPHFCSEWCIVGYGASVLWDLSINFLGSVPNAGPANLCE